MSSAAETTEPPPGAVAPAGAETPESAAPTTPVARRWPRVSWANGLAMTALVLGGGLWLANLGVLTPEARHVVEVAWPAAVVCAGVGLLAADERRWPIGVTPFRVERAEAEQAELALAAGMADVVVEALAEGDTVAAPGALAAGEWGGRGAPEVTRQGAAATVRLEPRWTPPTLGGAAWRVGLTAEVPWRLNARADTGNLTLDLAGVRPAEVRVRSVAGDVTLDLPTAGGAEMDLALALGDLTVRVPEGVGVKVRLRRGALTDVDHDDRRFITLGANELGTPLYAVAARRCTLTVWLGTGDLHLR